MVDVVHLIKKEPSAELAQRERLAFLGEELAEVLHVKGKIERHGWDATHPVNKAPTNKDLLEKELGDVIAAIIILEDAGDIDQKAVQEYAGIKVKDWKQGRCFTHFQ